MINRHCEKCHDFELTWAIWLLKEFKIQPTKEMFIKTFESKSVCASIIALDLLSKNKSIQSFDYTDIESLFTTDNLNSRYWLLIYESVLRNWIGTVSSEVVKNHLFFQTLKDNDVSFYDPNRKLEPLKVEKSYYSKIDNKIKQIQKYLVKNVLSNNEIAAQISKIFELLSTSEMQQNIYRTEMQRRLNSSDSLIREVLLKTESLTDEQDEFEKRRVYFVVGKRLEELQKFTIQEIKRQSLQSKNLLFDPDYE